MMRQPEKLVQAALQATKQEDVQTNRFVHMMVEQIKQFMKLYETGDVAADYDKFMQIFNSTPADLLEHEQEAYALHLHKLLKEGELYGMVHEDPYATLVLIGSALTIFRRLVVSQGKAQLLPKVLDLFLLQSIAFAAAGGHEVAKIGLTTLLSLTQSNEIEKEFMVQHTQQVQIDVQTRAATGALVLAALFEDEANETKAGAARVVAKEMFSEILKSERGTTTRVELLTAAVALAEVSMKEDKAEESANFLDLAIDYVQQDLKLAGEAISAPYYFIASIVFKKRAFVWSAIHEDYEAAKNCLAEAVRLSGRCVALCTNNAHYQDHHGELLNDLGVLHGVMGNFLESNAAFIEAIENRQKLFNQSKQYVGRLIAALSNFAVLMRTFGHWTVAKQYMEEALHLLEVEAIPEGVEGTAVVHETLSRAVKELTVLMNPKQKLWVPLASTSNKYGPN